MMRDTHLGLVVWSPLAFGFLSGKYTWENLKDQGNRLAGADYMPLGKEWGFRVVDAMREIGGRHGASPAQVAIA